MKKPSWKRRLLLFAFDTTIETIKVRLIALPTLTY